MNASTTAIYLKDTNHVLAAYTQRSGAKEPPTIKQREQRFSHSGLQLRFIERYVPTSPAIITPIALKSVSSSVEVNSDVLGNFAEGDRLLIKSSVEDAIIRVTKITPNLNTNKSSVGFVFERSPKEDIAAGASIAVVGRSPSTEPFQFTNRFLAAVVLPPDAIDLLSRPTSFAIKDGKPDLLGQVQGAIRDITFTVRLTGVHIAVGLDSAKSMDSDIPVVGVLRTATRENVVSTITIPKVSLGSTKSEATIPFAAIPSGDNYFLFMLKGIRPIWDRLAVNGTRIWTPTSP